MPKFKLVMEAVMAPYKEVYKDIHKKAEESQITSFITESSFSPLPYILCRSVSQTTFFEEHWCHCSQHQPRCFSVY
jgi:hypothetical protein